MTIRQAQILGSLAAAGVRAFAIVAVLAGLALAWRK